LLKGLDWGDPVKVDVVFAMPMAGTTMKVTSTTAIVGSKNGMCRYHISAVRGRQEKRPQSTTKVIAPATAAAKQPLR
jgi:hypothetical protein